MNKGPKYIVLADQIKAQILNGTYPVNSMLPTEKEFETLFNVSKITVRNAIDILANEGYVVKQSGRGTTVISDRLFNKLSKAVSFSTILEKEHVLEKNIIAYEEINVEDEDIFHVFGHKANKLTRTYVLDGVPYIYFEHYTSSFRINEEKDVESINSLSLYRFLLEHGQEVASFSDSFKVVKIPTQVERFLHTGQNKILLRLRKSIDKKGNIIEISYGYYNTELHPYTIEYEI